MSRQKIFETPSTFTNTSLSLLICVSKIDFKFLILDVELEDGFARSSEEFYFLASNIQNPEFKIPPAAARVSKIDFKFLILDY